MTDNWWRCPRSSEKLETRSEDKNWPELSIGNKNKRRPVRRKVWEFSNGDDRGVVDQTRTIDRSNVLDSEGYPELGRRLVKRKLPGTESPIPGCSREIVEAKKFGLGNGENIDEDSGTRKISKQSRRTALICIDIGKVLERQRSMSESQTSSSLQPRIKLKMNLNLSIRNPLDSAQVIQYHKGIRREVPRAKKISKLKRVIFREREIIRQTNLFKHELIRQKNILKRRQFDVEKLHAMTKDVNDIDFNRLQISGEPKPEVTVARNIAAMTLFDKEYRISQSAENIPNDLPEINNINDIVTKFENIPIHRNRRDVSPEVEDERKVELLSEHSIDSNILARTLHLKICDETGETVEEFKEPEVPRSDAPERPETGTGTRKHSKKFREYCTNDLTPGLKAAAEKFLAETYRLQKRMYVKDESKGRCRRRFYAGFKEVLKHVQSKKIKFVFIAPDLEGIHGYPGGLDDIAGKLIADCHMKEVVICFSLSKRKLGYYTHKKGSVACVGITNYSGLEEIFNEVLTELMLARNSYWRFTAPVESGNALNSESQEWKDTLLSTKINLLYKSLTVPTCSKRNLPTYKI